MLVRRRELRMGWLRRRVEETAGYIGVCHICGVVMLRF
jgi:hypothetical protein